MGKGAAKFEARIIMIPTREVTTIYLAGSIADSDLAYGALAPPKTTARGYFSAWLAASLAYLFKPRSRGGPVDTKILKTLLMKQLRMQTTHHPFLTVQQVAVCLIEALKTLLQGEKGHCFDRDSSRC